ncbi:tyrosine-type recombinase/integrase [Knoellia sp. LjRoot47]|uniref:tyrosine-type recombinase/integrase n=1 Tax=Knoellia sp. LjRoot47 TaxID=3342330 RepID=UPI003ED003B9
MVKSKRRDKGDGSLFQRHTKDCPPAVPTEQPDGTTKRERPKHRCNGLWIARVELDDDNGKRRVKERARKDYADAVKVLRELRKEVAVHGTIATGSMSVETWLRHWHAEVVSVTEAPSTVASYRSIIENQLIPTLGKKRLDRLTPEHVRQMHKTLRARVTVRGKPLAESSILKAHNVLSSALGQAHADGKVNRNVARIAKKPTLPDVDKATLTADQVRHFLRANAEHPLLPRFATALFTGERQGEVIGLTIDRLDLEHGIADVTWQLQRIKFRHGCNDTCGMKRAGSCPKRELNIRPGLRGAVQQLDGGLCLTRPKSRKGKRLVPLHPFLVALLTEHLRRAEPNPHGLVFARPDGRPLDPRRDLDEWYAALERAGMDQHGTHLARRVVATSLRAKGTDRKTMRDVLGHATDQSTDHYLTGDLELAQVAMLAVGNEFTPRSDDPGPDET